MILKRVTSQNLITPRKVKENPAARVINLRQMNVYKDVDRPFALCDIVFMKMRVI